MASDSSTPLQNFEAHTRTQPHDRTFMVPLDDARVFQITVTIIEPNRRHSLMQLPFARKPSAEELIAGLAMVASMPIRTPNHHHRP